MSLLLVHAAATCFLAGLSWVVQVVVYPGFLVVGPTPQWQQFHAAHSRRIALVVGPPWAVQGGCVALLLVRGEDLVLVAATAVLAAATVALTVFGAVPAHERLATYDEVVVATLLRASAWRTFSWSVGAVLSIVLVARV